jgi:hypothetical protein
MLNEKIHDSYSLCIALAYQSGDVGNQALASYPTACFALRALQGFALPWLMSFNARQQFFFQQSLALPEPLNLRLETIEELDDLAVLMTKRVEAWVCRHQSAHGLFILGEPC